MRVVLASSEAVPFSKTGGLADVASALAKALSAAGHHVWLIVPNYPREQARRARACPQIKATGHAFQIQVGPKQVAASLFWSELPGSDVTVFLVEQAEYFDRAGLYSEQGEDYRDNCERFAFFSRSVLEIARKLFLRPDVVHAHDWQTGLIPALLNIEYQHVSGFERTASAFTIHNMAFQGAFWHWDMLLTGLDWKYFNWRQMEAWGNLNLMKTGIVFSDMITTVSPSYAREIQTAEGGFGLHGVLAGRRDDLVGILNGVDTTIWNPRSDPHIAQNYSLSDIQSRPVHGKAACKTHLQQVMGLPARNDVPLFGMISRMTEQKGFDLIAERAETLLDQDLQICFLGTGESFYQEFLTDLARRFPEKVSVRIGFDDALAHQIEAGADAYLMPSQFEPCGLTQMYSLIYGTVPVVRSVGGLADSVVDCTPETLRNGTATGFCFEEYTGEAFARAVRRAVDSYRRPEIWEQLIANGMKQDWSWNRSAEQYTNVYEQAQAKRIRH